MFKPKYAISPKILANIRRIAALTQELNDKRFPKIVYMELLNAARAVSAYSSTSIEGNPLPLSEVKKILKSAPAHIRDTEREVLNYNKALERLVKEKDTSTDLICETQKIVTEGLIAPYRSGKFREEPVFVNDPRTRHTVYLPPDHDDVKELMTDLVVFSDGEKKSGNDPIVTAGIFHRQFVIIHPFMDGNGRTARLMTKVLLANMGLDTFNPFSFENYYNKDVGKYFGKVGLLGNYYELKENIDFTEWLEYFSDGIIDELLRVKKELSQMGNISEARLRPGHKVILDYLEKNGSMTDVEYSKLTDRAKATRALHWKTLIELGLIERRGKGKNTYYVKKS